jgi:hypothetical protein
MAGALSRLLRAAVPAALALACMPGAVHAAFDITWPEARAFLGGRSGKIAYLKTQLKQVYYIDFSDSTPTEHKVADDTYCWSPMISPEGGRIVYETGAAIYIRNLEENAKDRHLIYTGVPRNNHSLEPHWWIHPKTKDEYIMFTTGDASDVEWPPKSGETYMQKIVNNEPSGPLLTLLPFMMASGRSKNGLWGGTSHHSTGMYKLAPDSVSKAFVSAKNWIDSGGWGACNGSMSPSSDPARQNRLMHLNSYLALPGGEIFENHKAVVIRSWDDKDVNSPIWAMGTPGLRCNNDSSGNLFWDHCEWSTDENYFTVVGSKVIENWTEGDLYVGRIDYAGKNNQIRRILAGGGLNHYPNLWIKDGIAPAKIRLNKTLLQFISLKKDSAGPAPDTVRITNAGDGTLPLLKLDTLPAWLKVKLVGNGTNAPLAVVTVDRVAAGLGEHAAVVRLSFGQSADSASFTVRLKYSDPVFTTLKPAFQEAVLTPGDSLVLTATALDQTGAPMAPQPDVAWSALEAGEALPIAPGGLVIADSSLWTAHPYRGSSGALACTTTVFISKLSLRIDAGNPSGPAPKGWTLDVAESATGGTPERLTQGRVDLNGVANAGPESIYRSVSHTGGFSFPALPNSRYAVRFHFSSPFPGDAVPPATSIKVEGAALIENYLPPAKPDSGVKGETRDLLATVSDGDGLQIGFTGAPEGVQLAGLEIHDIGRLAITLLHPDGGEAFRVGDTLRANWETDGLITSVGLQISPDSGKTWIPVTRRSAVNQGQPDWGDYPWVIPDSLDGKSLVTTKAILSVYDYFGTDRDRSNRSFTILPAETALRARIGAAPGLKAEFSGGRLSLRLPQPGRYRYSLVDVRSRAILSGEASGPGPVSVPAAGIPRGVYRLTVIGAGFRASRSLTRLD